jgi:ABC-2 type transport system permease protein/lipopolysaccharide transport system permease protein
MLRSNGSGLVDALRDVREGWDWHELWLTLGWRDVLLRHRRSRLGPFWISISMAFIAGCMGSLYSAIMQRSAHDYIPYLVAGFMAWNFASALINEGRESFVANAASMREIPVPGTVYVYRLLWRNLLIFGYNAIVYVIVLFIFQLWPFPALLLVLPALGLILLNGLWAGLLLGVVNARFRDFGQLIPNAMRLVFFVTPVIWYAESATGYRSIFVHFNPMYYFIELLRAPLLGQVPGHLVWGVALGITIVGWGITLPVYAYWRRRITFWI